MNSKQETFDKAYLKAKESGYNTLDSIEIAKKVISTPKLVTGKKSFALNTNNYNSGNIIDILVGYPGADTEEIYGGRVLEHSGWKKVPNKPMTFDLNHFGFDVLNGVRNDLEEYWQDLKIKVSDWYYDEEGLKAKAYIPETNKGQEFLEDYKKGKYGVSIEYKGIEDGKVIKDWEIIGGTFHEDPSFTATKPKSL